MTSESIERLSTPKSTDWSVIKALWCADTPNPDLAQEFKVTEEAIRAQASRNDWAELRDIVRKRMEKSSSQAVTGAVNIVQSYKDRTIQNVAEAGLMTSAGLKNAVKDSNGSYPAMAEAFAVFEPTARVLKPFLGLNDQTQSNVSVSFHALSDIPQSECWEIDAVQVEKGDVKSAT